MIEIKYKCLCMLNNAEVLVRERALGEDAPVWMSRAVIPEVSLDHRKRSPFCMMAQLEHIMVPIQDNVLVGNIRKN